MLKKFLVALDRSANHIKVFEEALTLAQAMGARLMLLHVLSPEEISSPKMPLIPVPEYYPGLSTTTLEIYQEQWKRFEQEGLNFLRSLQQQATAAGVQTEFWQNSGSPGRTICDLARTWKADAIVMGRRGHSGLSELLMGSVSNFVVHHATCSIFIVNQPSQWVGQLQPDNPTEGVT